MTLPERIKALFTGLHPDLEKLEIALETMTLERDAVVKETTEQVVVLRKRLDMAVNKLKGWDHHAAAAVMATKAKDL